MKRHILRVIKGAPLPILYNVKSILYHIIIIILIITIIKIRFSLEQFGSRRLSSQGKSSKTVHNKIHPQKLHSSDGTLSTISREGSNEGKGHGHDVHSKLELNELTDSIENVTSPHSCSNDGSKVIIQKHDI